MTARLTQLKTRGRGKATATLCAILASMIAVPAGAAVRDQIVVVGSSTVYPFSSVVAERFSKSGPFRMPSLLSNSTEEGFQQFCAGVGADTPDISNASRRMSSGERADCAANGVRRIAEIRIGYDSLIVGRRAGAPNLDISLEQLWRAIAKSVPINGAFVPNPYKKWRDIAPGLPDLQIKIFGPAPGHGTRDALVALVMEPSCSDNMVSKALPAGERKIVCESVREDGLWTDTENIELILGTLATHPEAVGILTYSYLEQFPNRIQAATLQGVAPSRSTIPTGEYPVSRPLYIYVKEEHLNTTAGLGDYVAEFLSSCAAGSNGYLLDEGLVPLPMPELTRQRAIAARLIQ
jgi:phosphate transport system substrate-binding protein